MLRCNNNCLWMVLLIACSGNGKVSVDGDVDLDRIRSATWLQSDPIPFSTFSDGQVQDLGEVNLTPLNLLSYNRGCVETRRDLEDWATLSTAVLEASSSGSDEATCDAMTALSAWQDAETADLPSRRTVVQGGVGALDGDALPESGVTVTESVYATVIVIDTTDCEPAVTWDDEACAPKASECGEVQTYELEDGVLDVHSAALSVRADLTGNLEGDGGEDIGPFDASFDALVCDLGAAGPLVVY